MVDFTREPAGYALLFWRYRLDPELLERQSYIRSDHRPREVHDEGGQPVETFPVQYRPDDASDWSHLVFALKYDGVNLLALALLVPHLHRDELAAGVQSHPTSKNGRRLFFLFEWLTGERLGLDDLTLGTYCPVLEPDKYFTAAGVRSRRHRVFDNLLGDRTFCPLVRRSEALAIAATTHWGRRVERLTESVDPVLLARTIWYLYTKETRSSFAIEREDPGTRIERYLEQLSHIGDLRLDTEGGLTELQNSLVDERYADRGFRREGDDEVYVGQTLGLTQKVHHVGTRSAAVAQVMEGWARQRDVIGDGGAVVSAACRSFSFVFIHPFSDGNGRVHRLLLHHVLARMRYLPATVVVPISSVILADIGRYGRALEAFSSRAILPSQLQYTLDDDGRMTVVRQCDELFRYPDLTPQTEATFDWLMRAVEEDLPRELDFLRRFDEVRTRLREVVEMPDRKEQLFVKLCLQNNGRISSAKRAQFAELDDETMARLEAIVRSVVEGEE